MSIVYMLICSYNNISIGGCKDAAVIFVEKTGRYDGIKQIA